MPNFWTKTTQFFDEALNGPRTNNTEFNRKKDEIKRIENGLSSLKHLLSNFASQTNQIKNLFQNISSIISNIYIDCPEYESITNEIINAHQEMITFYGAYVDKMAGLNAQAGNIKEMFKEANKALEQREEKRKVFDHYDEKLEKIKKKKNRDYEYQRRNEEKFIKAKDEFFNSSEQTAQIVNETLSNRFNVINPLICEYLTEQKLFMQTISNVLSKFSNLDNQLTKIEIEKSKKAHNIPINNNNNSQPINQANYYSNNVLPSNNSNNNFNFDFDFNNNNFNNYTTNNNTHIDSNSSNVNNYPKYSHVSSSMYNNNNSIKKSNSNEGCPYPIISDDNELKEEQTNPNNKNKKKDDLFSNYNTYNNYPLNPNEEKDPFQDLF